MIIIKKKKQKNKEITKNLSLSLCLSKLTLHYHICFLFSFFFLINALHLIAKIEENQKAPKKHLLRLLIHLFKNYHFLNDISTLHKNNNQFR